MTDQEFFDLLEQFETTLHELRKTKRPDLIDVEDLARVLEPAFDEVDEALADIEMVEDEDAAVDRTRRSHTMNEQLRQADYERRMAQRRSDDREIISFARF